MPTKADAPWAPDALAHAAPWPALAMGTPILTLAGQIPVEYLTPGDRVITRDGARTLRALDCRHDPAAVMIRIRALTLGADRPEDDVLLTPDMPILIRDWRAMALRGTPSAVFTARALVDGTYIRVEAPADTRLFSLAFDQPVVIYAGGLELALPPMPALAAA